MPRRDDNTPDPATAATARTGRRFRIRRAVALPIAAALVVGAAGAGFAVNRSGSEQVAASPQPAAKAAVAPAAPKIVNTKFPIRAAFVYPWYAENFAGASGGSQFDPSAGKYSMDKATTIDRQIKDMKYAGLQAGIASWWGKGLREDKRMPRMMARAAKLKFSWSAYYEKEGYGNPSAAKIAADLKYLRKYSDKPAWLHVKGKPVIFVWADGNDGCDMAARWAKANQTAKYYVVLKVFGGYQDCAKQPQGWHQYGAGLDVQRGYSAMASPGFWLNGEATPMKKRNLAQFRKDVTVVARSKERFQLIISYNEWGEGTAVESAKQWSSANGHGKYIDILHKVFRAYPR